MPLGAYTRELCVHILSHRRKGLHTLQTEFVSILRVSMPLGTIEGANGNA